MKMVDINKKRYSLNIFILKSHQLKKRKCSEQNNKNFNNYLVFNPFKKKQFLLFFEKMIFSYLNITNKQTEAKSMYLFTFGCI